MPIPEWKPTDEERALVRAMAKRGHGSRIIALRLDVDKNTLKKHCKAELAAGRTDFADRLADVHLVCLEDEDPRVRQVSAIWLEKSRLHYSDHMKQEISGPEGQPLQVQPILNVTLSGNKPEPA